MSSCKECVHYEACKNILLKAFPKTTETEIEAINNKECNCPHFKPKSRFVELPCEVGQTVYFVGVLTQQIVPSKVVSISYNNGGFYLMCENHLVVSVTELLGKTVFLSREEAEKALAERSK